MVTSVVSQGSIRLPPDLTVLDRAPEPSFDRFTRLAAELLGAPVSLICLVDRDRQFFKSHYGLPQAWADGRQTPLSHSICRHVVASRKPLIIEDARRHELVADSLAVRDLSVQAYAGIPLVLEDGSAVGCFCAIDTKPRRWSPRELRILEDLGAAVKTLLDLRCSVAQPGLRDRLTGLPDRTLTVAQAEQVGGAFERGEMLAIVVGINDLGAINEVYGTDHGDRVLQLVAGRIARQLGTDDILGRLEGDVFAILRPGVSDQLEALALAHAIRDGVSAEAVRIRGDQLLITATAGIATGDTDTSAGQLITRAVEAMRVAKSSRDRVRFADGRRAESSAERLRVRGALPGAVARGEVTVAFQPIVEISSGSTRGFEALARWTHPDLGCVAPSEFIPVAEASGEIVRIGEHVLRTACQQLARWRTQSGRDLHVTVNLSPIQLALPDLADVLRAILAETGLPGRVLALEITEGMLVAAGVVTLRNLEQIRQLGIQIALDDFGTGYSALGYLKSFPVDVIKADRSFLDGLGTDRRDLAVLRAILAIGDGMDIQVVVEGVETQRQRELLRLSGCPLGQGFLFSPPLPAEEIEIGPRRPLGTRSGATALA
ncbi:MAG: putative bifunctional diguanylate cyclase/phosphodiesterase [Solirubrobacteraceae bacterium]